MREPRGAGVWKGMEVMEVDGEVVGTGMKTRITELLGTEYPLIQGGMAWVAECRLAAAVSEAGGFGIIGAGAAPAQFVREQIRQCRAMTDKPFGVNIMLMNPEADAIARVVAQEGVKAVTTGAGNPGRYMADWKAAGVKSRYTGSPGNAFSTRAAMASRMSLLVIMGYPSKWSMSAWTIC